MKKKRLSEKLGGGPGIGLGGVNSNGPHQTRYKYKNPSGYHTGGHQGDADSIHSQRMSLTLEEEDDMEKNEEETKESLYEFFARLAKLPIEENKRIEEGHCNIEEGHCSTHESSCTMSENNCDEAIRLMEEQELEEMSTVASLGGGPTTPLGTDAKGNIPNNKRRKDRIDHAKSTYGGK